MLAADGSAHLDLGDDALIAAGQLQILAKGEVREMRQCARAAIAADAIAADLRLDIDIFLDLGVPIIRFAGKGEKRNAADLLLGSAVTQIGAGVDDLLKAALEGDFVALEKFADAVELLGRDIAELGGGAERDHLGADIDFTGRHILADALAGIAQNDDAPAIHHIAGHEVGVAAA